jgi:endonuclease-3
MAKRSAKKAPPRKSVDQRKTQAEKGIEILRLLRKEFPGATTALLHDDAFQLLVATILSAQCTDERVNMVTPGLFKKYPTAKHLASADQSELEQEIRSTGFYKMKAKNIIACSKALVEKHNGVVPQTVDELVQLPGVGRKTANVVLGQAYGISSGIVVDTHVHRLSQRLGLSSADTAEKIEEDLLKIFPRSSWIDVGSVLILHGRKTCNARKPNCPECTLRDLCPSADAFLKQFR